MPASLHELIYEIDLWWWVIAAGSVSLALTVVVLARFRVIQSQPIRACIVLSVLAHFLLLGTVHLLRLFDAPNFPGDNTIQFQLTLDDETFDPTPPAAAEPVQPPEPRWTPALPEPEAPPRPDPSSLAQDLPTPSASPAPAVELKPPAAEPAAQPEPELERDPEPGAEPDVEPVPAEPPPLVIDQPPPEPAAEPTKETTTAPAAEPAVEPPTNMEPSKPPRSLDLTSPAIQEDQPPVPQQVAVRPTAEAAPKVAAAADQLQRFQSSAGPKPRPEDHQAALRDVPPAANSPAAKQRREWRAADPVAPRYRLRDPEKRWEVAKRRGGTKSTEAAVEEALKWLATNQEPDGRWSAAKHHAGRGGFVEGQHRHATGMQADTGVSGLALLALLGSGHTHQRGSHQQTVQNGLEFLLSQQRANGSLAGSSATFAQMYCHGIATLALCEAYAMTQDPRLEPFTRRAVEFTVRSQHRTTGGWRYYPGDPGDTSQFGWQLMVVESARQAGINVPAKTRALTQRFLSSVASGAHDGLASYRPGQSATVSMTAEALACRAFLGQVDPRMASEAASYIMSRPPERSNRNLYYWYYGTLALHQLDSEHWPAWNAALHHALIPTQKRRGRLAGSWDNDTVWGGCGGRVYTTAMAALCLEVYYRYLPVYRHDLARQPAR